MKLQCSAQELITGLVNATRALSARPATQILECVKLKTGQGEIAVPEDLRGRMAEGVVLAVSLEPFGGSPTGKATGPVLAVGPIHP